MSGRGENGLCESSRVEGSERGVLDAFAKPLETVLHNNLLEKWQRDAKMSETTPNSDDFLSLTVNLTPGDNFRTSFVSGSFRSLRIRATLQFIIPKDRRKKK